MTGLNGKLPSVRVIGRAKRRMAMMVTGICRKSMAVRSQHQGEIVDQFVRRILLRIPLHLYHYQLFRVWSRH